MTNLERRLAALDAAKARIAACIAGKVDVPDEQAAIAAADAAFDALRTACAFKSAKGAALFAAALQKRSVSDAA